MCIVFLVENDDRGFSLIARSLSNLFEFEIRTVSIYEDFLPSVTTVTTVTNENGNLFLDENGLGNSNGNCVWDGDLKNEN